MRLMKKNKESGEELPIIKIIERKYKLKISFTGKFLVAHTESGKYHGMLLSIENDGSVRLGNFGMEVGLKI